MNPTFSECPLPPILPNSMIGYSQYGPITAGVAVIYTCKPGYRYEDGGQSRSFVCINHHGNRMWHLNIVDCISKCTFLREMCDKRGIFVHGDISNIPSHLLYLCALYLNMTWYLWTIEQYVEKRWEALVLRRSDEMIVEIHICFIPYVLGPQ